MGITRNLVDMSFTNAVEEASTGSDSDYSRFVRISTPVYELLELIRNIAQCAVVLTDFIA